MHELSIAQDIIRIVEDNVRQAEATKVYEIDIEIGQFSGVVEEALVFALDAITEGTILEGCVRKITKVTTLAKCESCSFEFSPEFEYTPCPKCGNFGFDLLKGKELRIKSLKVE